MKAFYYILGVLAFIAGVLCLINPFESFMALSLIVSVFLLIAGLFFIMMFFVGRKDRNMLVNKPAIGIIGLILGIVMVVISILSVAVPSIDDALDVAMLIVFSVWMIINGIVSIFTGASLHRQHASGWGMMIVLGILVAAAGIYGMLHLAIFQEALGIVLGFLLLLFGVDMICGGFTDPDFN